MTTTVERRRIEVLVDAPLVRTIIGIAQEVGITGYTLLPTLGGAGANGLWSDDQITGVQAKVLFLAVTSVPKATQLIERLEPLLDSHGLVVLNSPVEVIRAAKF